MSALRDPSLWALVFAFLGVGIGLIVSKRLPGGALRARYPFRPKLGFVLGVMAAGVIGNAVGSTFLGIVGASFTALVIGGLVAWYASRLPNPEPPRFLITWWRRLFEDDESAAPESVTAPLDQMVFSAGWNRRPRFESSDKGLFVGRNELLGRLSSHFTSKGGGTILISGVRGVGKTALVDRSLVDARQKLANDFWEEAAAFLEDRLTPWHPIDLLTYRTLLKLGESIRPDQLNEPLDAKNDIAGKMKRGAREFVRRPPRRFLNGPVSKRIRAIYDAAESQLFVLKFSASDIAGAMAEPEQKATGKPRIDPEKLLRSLIRKLHMTCHSSSQCSEARVLHKSLCTKKKQQAFIQTLENAFNKSVSRSYKEVISNSINDFSKDQRTLTSESQLSIVRLLIGVVVVAGLYFVAQGAFGQLVFQWSDVNGVWNTLKSQFPGLVAGGIGAYLTWTVNRKRTRQKGSDKSSQSNFSYEYDFSIERMQGDLESLMRALQPSAGSAFHPYRCFNRSVVIFDELDKLDNADKQLDDVITHFKNFFTLSDSVFVFLTDHQFYEYLNREAIRAQRARHYSPQHTFFTEKIYLRKPEFSRFREAFYKFTSDKWIQKRATSLPPDSVLIEHLLFEDNALELINGLPIGALTHLYIHRNAYTPSVRGIIERQFVVNGGRNDPFALAQIWASQAASDEEPDKMNLTKGAFQSADGQRDSKAVSYLYFCRDDFKEIDDKTTITSWYKQLGDASVTDFQSVRAVPFALGDLAEALCFQTRNHYFDLYQLVYDYVSTYADGSPVIVLDDVKFNQETRLSSRYQRLLEIAFDAVKESQSSSDYFNGLLMESLYGVFDKRGTSRRFKVGDVLFQASETHQRTSWINPKSSDDGITTYSERDVEKINNAIVRLLRSAFDHGAISFPKDTSTGPQDTSTEPQDTSTGPQDTSTEPQDTSTELLKANPIRWKKLKDLEFDWTDDIQSIIKLPKEKEPYEQALIEFWNQNCNELEAFDDNLSDLWAHQIMPLDAEKLRNGINELRAKSESVRLRSKRISEIDAAMLKAGVMTREARNALMSKTILDRIRAEEDSYILDEAATTITDAAIRAKLVKRKNEFVKATGARLTAVICPRNTDAYIFFTSHAVPRSANNGWPNFPEPNDVVLWYSSDKDEFQDRERTWFYYAPPNASSAHSLFNDYRSIATEARLQRVIAHLAAADLKDTTLATRAGAEALGPDVYGSKLVDALTKSDIATVISLLEQARLDFAQQGSATWTNYGIPPPSSGREAIDRLAIYIGSATGASPTTAIDFKQAAEDALKQHFAQDALTVTADEWVRLVAATTTNTNPFAPGVTNSVVKQVLRESLDQAFGSDTLLRHAVEQAIVPWVTKTIAGLADLDGTDLATFLPKYALWADELEKQRRSFRSVQLSPTPHVSRLRLIRQSLKRSAPRRRPAA